MAFYGSASPADRAFAALAYILPLYVGLTFGQFLFQEFPFMQILALPALPLVVLNGAIPFGDFIVFLALLFFVIRNPKVNYFIRFNVMQAILLDIALVLVSLIMVYLLNPVLGSLGGGFMLQTLINMFFLAMIAAVGYGVFKSVQGTLADEIPAISEAARMQMPY